MKLFRNKILKEQSGGDNDKAGSRRSFLQNLGLGGMLVSVAGFGFQSLRSLIPNVLYEVPQKFKIGLPANLAHQCHRLAAARRDEHLHAGREATRGSAQRGPGERSHRGGRIGSVRSRRYTRDETSRDTIA